MNFVYNLNLKNLNSLLINEIIEDNITDFFQVNLPFKLTEKQINEFNERKITPENVNIMIKLYDFLMIQNTESLILNYSLPTEQLYVLSNENIINGKPKINIPEFMKTNNKQNLIAKPEIINSKNILYDMTEFEEPNVNICFYAAKYGLINWLKWGYQKYGWGDNPILIPWIASAKDKLDCLEYSHIKGCEFNFFIAYQACVFNNFTCLEYILKNKLQILDPIGFKSCHSISIANGNLECLKLLYKYGYDILYSKFNIYSYEYITNNSLNCCKFLIKNDKNFKINNIFFSNIAAALKNLEMFKYFESLNCPISTEIFSIVAESQNNHSFFNFKILSTKNENYLNNIYKFNSEEYIIEFLKYLYSKNYKVCQNNTFKCSNIKVLQYLNSIGVQFKNINMLDAAKNGNLELMKMLYNHKCPTNDIDNNTQNNSMFHSNNIFEACIYSENIDCCKFAYNHNFPKPSNFKKRCNNIYILQYLKSIGIHFNFFDLEYSLSHDNLTCFKYILDNLTNDDHLEKFLLSICKFYKGIT